MGENRAWRVGVWCAVSSQAQATEDKISLQHQEQRGREFAESIGGQVVAVYVVPGHSRDYVFWHEAEREMIAYREVRADLEAGRLDVIHAVDADRLGRDAALIQTFHSLAERHNCEVYSASAPHQIGHASAGQRYVAGIMAVRAGEDQSARVHRHAMGMRGRILRRGLHGNHLPIGYQPVRNGNGEVVGAEFDDRIGAVDLLTEWFLSGHSYAEMWRRINRSGYLSPAGLAAWDYSTVRAIMANDMYAGFVSWGDVRLDDPERSQVPARGGAETYRAIVRERQRRRVRPYNRRGGRPFSGVVFCARCGARMYSHQYTRGSETYHYMRCSTHIRRLTRGRCHSNNVAEHLIADALIGYFDRLGTPEEIDAVLDETGDRNEAERLAATIARVEGTLDDLEQQRTRLALAYAAQRMDAGVYAASDQMLSQRQDGERARLVDLRQRLDALPDQRERREMMHQLGQEFGRLLTVAAPAEIATGLQLIGIRVIVENGRVVRVEP